MTVTIHADPVPLRVDDTGAIRVGERLARMHPCQGFAATWFASLDSEIDQGVLDLCMRQGQLMGTYTSDPLHITIDQASTQRMR